MEISDLPEWSVLRHEIVIGRGFAVFGGDLRRNVVYEQLLGQQRRKFGAGAQCGRAGDI